MINIYETNLGNKLQLRILCRYVRLLGMQPNLHTRCHLLLLN